MSKTALIDNITVEITDETNLLQLIRKANIELPTFCYHKELSVFGSCRMCVVEVEGPNGSMVMPACSTRINDGMKVKTNTKQIRNLRKMIVELMLASHDRECTSCPKSGNCRLQDVAKQLGIDTLRFKTVLSDELEADLSSNSILKDQTKCVLCGNCVRMCKEVQNVGALDFAYRGAGTVIAAGLLQPMAESTCVGCGQCVKVCPVGALNVKPQIEQVWDAIHSDKTVVVQMAPAVRVALNEKFDGKPGDDVTGKTITALRMIGFDKVYDTCYGADLTVLEEGKEFLARLEKGEKLPLFTSCCPAWVKYAETNYPDLLPNLSSCKSPMEMTSALIKDADKNTVVVAIMPCTAKKDEALRDELKGTDFVITTTELAQMIKDSGVNFGALNSGAFDMPFGEFTGAAMIFGASGGVSEAVMRFAKDKLGGKEVKFKAVSGLGNAAALVEKIKNGEESYDLVEVMACCGGCVNGGGQPAILENECTNLAKRADALGMIDKGMKHRVSSENAQIANLKLDDHKAHDLLHTKYSDKQRTTKVLEAEAK